MCRLTWHFLKRPPQHPTTHQCEPPVDTRCLRGKRYVLACAHSLSRAHAGEQPDDSRSSSRVARDLAAACVLRLRSDVLCGCGARAPLGLAGALAHPDGHAAGWRLATTLHARRLQIGRSRTCSATARCSRAPPSLGALARHARAAGEGAARRGTLSTARLAIWVHILGLLGPTLGDHNSKNPCLDVVKSCLCRDFYVIGKS